MLFKPRMKFKELVNRVYPDNRVNSELIRYFEKRGLTEISPLMIEDYKTHRLTEVSGASTNRELACLKHCFQKAILWKLVKENPCIGIDFLKEKPRVRLLSYPEEDKLMNASPEWLRELILIALTTGMRSSEITGLTWPNIDFDNRTITIPETKNNEIGKVHLNQPVFDLLKSKDQSNPYARIFPGLNKYGVSRAFREVCVKSGIPNLRFHDLRAAFASRLNADGLNVFTIKDLLRHKTLVMSLRYCRNTTDNATLAIEKLAKLSCREQGKEAIEALKNDSTDFNISRRSSAVEQLIRNQ